MKNLQHNFETLVSLKFQLYNSLFLTLPIDKISNTGILLPILSESCTAGMEKNQSPTEIITQFFDDHEQFKTEKEKLDFLFRVIQYVERQVVLVDALEDAAYGEINELEGYGSFDNLAAEVKSRHEETALAKSLRNYAVRIVLTAHPTQFYPGNVLAIITDLTQAVRTNDLENIRLLLQQLGKTPFFRQEKPTPYDEAVNLSWYLENMFYPAASALYDKIANETQLEDDDINDKLFAFGFWPGGDRDGNPFVKSDTTLQVAERLQHILLRCYYQDIRKLRRRLSFKGIYERMSVLEGKFSDMLNKPGTAIMPVEELLSELNEIISTLKNDHNGLFATMVESFKNRVRLFRYHFASIDVRQDSRVISRSLDAILDHVPDLLPMGWKNAAEHEQLDYLFKINGDADAAENVDEIIQDTIDSFRVIRKIQAKNGESGAHRYIISNCRGAIDIARVFALARLSGWKENLDLDIIPLFETIDDLHRAHETMAKIYSHPVYKAHLKSRNNQQTVMLGFSDGTKDGGYLSANWNIYKAKENITKLSRKEDIAVIFFDGRGGPPARGGGNTQKFYTSLGSEIENKEIQLTVQGQTISSHYGTVVSAAHNIETLLVAGLENQLINDPKKKLANEERTLLEELAERSQVKYQALKSAKEFMPYLQKMSPMLYYGEANIGSRPSKRGKSTELKFEDLRAIPFVGAWSQIKQNVPGFYGVGTSLQQLEKEGRLKDCKKLYANSAFFRALCENSMQSLAKTYFPITRFMQADQEFGSFWQDLHDEYQLSCKMLLKVSGQKELLATSPTSRESIKLRENLVLPLITIQQFALTKIRELEASANPESASVYKKLVIRSMFGNINASRNSA